MLCFLRSSGNGKDFLWQLLRLGSGKERWEPSTLWGGFGNYCAQVVVCVTCKYLWRSLYDNAFPGCFQFLFSVVNSVKNIHFLAMFQPLSLRLRICTYSNGASHAQSASSPLIISPSLSLFSTWKQDPFKCRGGRFAWTLRSVFSFHTSGACALWQSLASSRKLNGSPLSTENSAYPGF